jgi:hypothetical protein
MASRTTPADVNLTFYTTGVITKPYNQGTTVGTAGQYQIWSDRAIWDTTNNVYLYPNKDFDPYAIFGD